MKKQYKHICDYCGKEHMIGSTVYNRLINGKQKKCYCSKECANNAKHTGHMIICDNCGKMFYRRKYHIDRQNDVNGKQFCSVECESEYKHKEAIEIRTCEICGKEYKCKKISTQRFCSRECQGKWQSTQIGIINPRYKHKEVICKWCGEPYMAKNGKVEKGTTSFCSAFCRQEYYRRILCKESKYVEIHRKCALDNLEQKKYSTINSEPQRILDSLLIENNIKFEREFRTNYYSIDNYLPDHNLMIEVMGDFWHCNPMKYDSAKYEMQRKSLSRDKMKHDYILKTYGIEILYLWENDLKNNLSKCLEFIMEYIDNKGVLPNYHSFNYYNCLDISFGY